MLRPKRLRTPGLGQLEQRERIYIYIYIYKSSPKDIFSLLLRERIRERNIDVREKHQLAASQTRPDWESLHALGPEMEPTTLRLWEGTPTN